MNSTVIETVETVSTIVRSHLPDMAYYQDLYQWFHSHPELSRSEKKTGEKIVEELKGLPGFEIRTNVGGHGVVGVLKNDTGKAVLLRAETDALPILEETNLSYASTVRAVDVVDGKTKPVMHACGHDLHMVSLLAAAKLLHDSKHLWRGTVIALFQPDEETGAGAQAMVEDGLFDPLRHDVPTPDVALGGHIMPLKTGLVKTRPGVICGAADTYSVTVYGRGGHGSRPHTAVDPVVMASSIVLKLHTIVGREIDPRETAVLTVGSIHAGAAANVISNQATLQVNIRAFKPEIQSHLLEAMTRMIKAECLAFGSPKEPLLEHTGSFPILHNDEASTDKVAKTFKKHFGANFDMDAAISTGSEDFANLTLPLSIPTVFWNYGGIDSSVWDTAAAHDRLMEIPGTHLAPILRYVTKGCYRESQFRICACNAAYPLDCSRGLRDRSPHLSGRLMMP